MCIFLIHIMSVFLCIFIFHSSSTFAVINCNDDYNVSGLSLFTSLS